MQIGPERQNQLLNSQPYLLTNNTSRIFFCPCIWHAPELLLAIVWVPNTLSCFPRPILGSGDSDSPMDIAKEGVNPCKLLTVHSSLPFHCTMPRTVVIWQPSAIPSSDTGYS